MEILRRGTPPYEVWNDSKERPPFKPQKGYCGSDYFKALVQIFDLTNAGQRESKRIPIIKDANGDIVF